tara:strand:- start:6217 stop:7302 length:1086 start_codon:yes stop_codon:yes gene_type:complete
MGSVDFTTSRLGEAQGGSTDPRELFLKLFSGEVLAAFQERNLMMPLHTVRTITSGSSAQFPLTGKATASYHAPGTELTGASINHAERVIHIDNLLVSQAFIANIDEAMNHYDVRSIYAKELGHALANHADKAIIRSGIAGALDVTDALGENTTTGGRQVTTGGTGNGAIDAIMDAAKILDENNVPQEDRYCILTPTIFYAILKKAGAADSGGAILNRDFGPGGSMLLGGQQVLTVGGIKVLMSTHIPTADELDQDNDAGADDSDATLGDITDGVVNDPFDDADAETTLGQSSTNAAEGYSGLDFTNFQGLVFQRSGIGTVKLMDLAVESDYMVSRQGTLMVARYAMGHNYLRSQCNVLVKN